MDQPTLKLPLVAIPSQLTPAVAEIYDAGGVRLCHINAALAIQLVQIINASQPGIVDAVAGALKAATLFIWRTAGEAPVDYSAFIEMAAMAEVAVRHVDPNWVCYLDTPSDAIPA